MGSWGSQGESQKKKAGYEYLLAYKITVPIYDYTVEFCRRWIDYKSRTKDQMEQAARSGMTNIPEGYIQKSLASSISHIATKTTQLTFSHSLSVTMTARFSSTSPRHARRRHSLNAPTQTLLASSLSTDSSISKVSTMVQKWKTQKRKSAHNSKFKNSGFNIQHVV